MPQNSLLVQVLEVIGRGMEAAERIEKLLKVALFDAPFLTTCTYHVVRIDKSDTKVTIFIGCEHRTNETSYLKITIDKKTQAIVRKETSQLLLGHSQEGSGSFEPEDGPVSFMAAAALYTLLNRSKYKEESEQYEEEEKAHKISRHGSALLTLLCEKGGVELEVVELVKAAFKRDWEEEIFWEQRITTIYRAQEFLGECDLVVSYHSRDLTKTIVCVWRDKDEQVIAQGLYYPEASYRSEIKILRNNRFYGDDAVLLILLSCESAFLEDLSPEPN